MTSKPLVAGIDKPVSQLALGTAWYSIEQKDVAFDLLDRFAAHGGTTMDTARLYGTSEDVIGLWMEARGSRDETVVVTKGGLSEQDGNRLATEGIGDKIEQDITQSLEHLRTDYIDLLVLHRDTESIPVGESVIGAASARSAGRTGPSRASSKRTSTRTSTG